MHYVWDDKNGAHSYSYGTFEKNSSRSYTGKEFFFFARNQVTPRAATDFEDVTDPAVKNSMFLGHGISYPNDTETVEGLNQEQEYAFSYAGDAFRQGEDVVDFITSGPQETIRRMNTYMQAAWLVRSNPAVNAKNLMKLPDELLAELVLGANPFTRQDLDMFMEGELNTQAMSIKRLAPEFFTEGTAADYHSRLNLSLFSYPVADGSDNYPLASQQKFKKQYLMRMMDTSYSQSCRMLTWVYSETFCLFGARPQEIQDDVVDKYLGLYTETGRDYFQKVRRDLRNITEDLLG